MCSIMKIPRKITPASFSNYCKPVASMDSYRSKHMGLQNGNTSFASMSGLVVWQFYIQNFREGKGGRPPNLLGIENLNLGPIVFGWSH